MQQELTTSFLIEKLRVDLRNNKHVSNSKVRTKLLSLVKSKDWLWYERDMTQNIVLTYPMYFGFEECCEYLLKEKYDITKFDISLVNHIIVGLNVDGINSLSRMIDKLNFHQNYLNLILFEAYSCLNHLISKSDDLKNSYINTYKEFINKIINKTNFEEVFYILLTKGDISSFVDYISGFDFSEKTKYLVINKYLNKNLYIKEDKLNFMKKYKSYIDMKNNLLNKEKKVNLIKI